MYQIEIALLSAASLVAIYEAMPPVPVP